jgi:hypothetical protein
MKRYNSNQILAFQQFARECFNGKPADIHIDEGGMHAESPSDPTHTHLLYSEEQFNA